jgi:hypothetical protein
MVSKEQVADYLIESLNKLIEDPEVREDVSKLIDLRIPCSMATQESPLIQCVNNSVGFLGILNGIVGTIDTGKRAGWGFITAVYDDDGYRLIKFCRTENS